MSKLGQNLNFAPLLLIAGNAEVLRKYLDSNLN